MVQPRINTGTNFKTGAVIVFNSAVTKAVAQTVIDELVKRGLIESTSAHEFDPEWGVPTWYIP